MQNFCVYVSFKSVHDERKLFPFFYVPVSQIGDAQIDGDPGVWAAVACPVLNTRICSETAFNTHT